MEGVHHLNSAAMTYIIYVLLCYVIQAWPDSAVRREIANLKVKCENCMAGCDWKGLFKQLMVCPTIL